MTEYLMFILLTFLFAFILAAIYGVICYVFRAIALYRIAANHNLQYPWLAWVPVANAYLFGDIIDKLTDGRNYKLKLLIPMFFLAASGLIIRVPFYGVLAFAASIVYTVFYYVGLQKIYKTFIPEQSAVMTVLSIIFPIQDFLLFGVSNKTAVQN